MLGKLGVAVGLQGILDQIVALNVKTNVRPLHKWFRIAVKCRLYSDRIRRHNNKLLFHPILAISTYVTKGSVLRTKLSENRIL